jgi:hypothetical protein
MIAGLGDVLEVRGIEVAPSRALSAPLAPCGARCLHASPRASIHAALLARCTLRVRARCSAAGER